MQIRDGCKAENSVSQQSCAILEAKDSSVAHRVEAPRSCKNISFAIQTLLSYFAKSFAPAVEEIVQCLRIHPLIGKGSNIEGFLLML